jgi:hypothetical protein
VERFYAQTGSFAQERGLAASTGLQTHFSCVVLFTFRHSAQNRSTKCGANAQTGLAQRDDTWLESGPEGAFAQSNRGARSAISLDFQAM